METNFLSDLKYLGVTARLKRLNDNLSASIKQLYKENALDLEPSWHLIFLLLKQYGSLSMIQIAEHLELTQPAVTKMITRMKKRGYLEISSDQQDSRKKIISLTQKSEDLFPKFEKVWQAGLFSVQDILENNPDFMRGIEHFEKQLNEKSFKDRAIKHLQNSGNPKG